MIHAAIQFAVITTRLKHKRGEETLPDLTRNPSSHNAPNFLGTKKKKKKKTPEGNQTRAGNTTSKITARHVNFLSQKKASLNVETTKAREERTIEDVNIRCDWKFQRRCELIRDELAARPLEEEWVKAGGRVRQASWRVI